MIIDAKKIGMFLFIPLDKNSYTLSSGTGWIDEIPIEGGTKLVSSSYDLTNTAELHFSAPLEEETEAAFVYSETRQTFIIPEGTELLKLSISKKGTPHLACEIVEKGPAQQPEPVKVSEQSVEPSADSNSAAEKKLEIIKERLDSDTAAAAHYDDSDVLSLLGEASRLLAKAEAKLREQIAAAQSKHDTDADMV